MTRKPKTNRVARTRASGTWTEASFWSFLRSGLRRLSMRWPPIQYVLLSARRKYIGKNKNQKWEYKCFTCKGWFPRKQVQVDHINDCGTLKTYEDLIEFVSTLFCEEDELIILCKECHEKRHKAN
jgi:hypothetical protein